MGGDGCGRGRSGSRRDVALIEVIHEPLISFYSRAKFLCIDMDIPMMRRPCEMRYISDPFRRSRLGKDGLGG